MTPRPSRPRMPVLRRRMLLGGWILAGAAIVGRAGQLQVAETEVWRQAALNQHRASTDLVAPRGTIRDRDGVPLAISRESYRVEIATRALRDRRAVAALLGETLNISRQAAQRLTDPSDPWTVVPGRHDPSVRQVLGDVRGIHLTREVRRFYPHGDLARGVLGTVREGSGVGGVEQAYEEVLRGRPGRQVVAKDSEGRPIPGAVFEVHPPLAGGDVRLTLDLEVQEIARDALAEAMKTTGARGGDVIVADPRSGELLALVSLDREGGRGLSAVNTPYEPGSTLKPFTVAALLESGAAGLQDTVDAEEGYWIAPDGRPLRDIVPHGRITLEEALRVSSNVAVAKAALRLSPARQYQTLRDFGFGVPTGIPLPGEVAGTLRRPADWTLRSPVALAIGYETAVTPLQVAMAYGALANGGELMQPRLVRRVTDRTARTVERNEPRVVRRVVSERVADDLRRALEGVVEEGTGTAARLDGFRVAGKSGTSRGYVSGRGYRSGLYFASFAGFVPADDPQLLVFVKLELDDTEGSYYGGATAAPVTRATMEAVLAAHRAPIDRGALLRTARDASASSDVPPLRFASLTTESPSGMTPFTTGRAGSKRAGGASFEDAVGRRSGGPESGDENAGLALPDVAGLPARTAARRLHALGLRVRWEGTGLVRSTLPARGARLNRGDTVTVRARAPARGPTGPRSGPR